MLSTFLQTTAETIEAVPVQEELSFSLISMAAKGGWLMLVLLALSIVAIYIFGKKWWAISQAGKVDKNFIKDVDNYLMEGKVRSARALCRRSDTPVARMIEKGVERIDKPLGDIRIAVENVANVEVAKLEKGLPALATIAGGAPMIGFLGTVMGMVQAFFNMAQAGNNIDITLLSGGIYTAMITTVGGLIVGILAYPLPLNSSTPPRRAKRPKRRNSDGDQALNEGGLGILDVVDDRHRVPAAHLLPRHFDAGQSQRPQAPAPQFQPDRAGNPGSPPVRGRSDLLDLRRRDGAGQGSGGADEHRQAQPLQSHYGDIAGIIFLSLLR